MFYMLYFVCYIIVKLFTIIGVSVDKSVGQTAHGLERSLFVHTG